MSICVRYTYKPNAIIVRPMTKTMKAWPQPTMMSTSAYKLEDTSQD